MGIKACFKCGEIKPLSDFYKHKKMADGHLNKCKECTKKDVALYREENIEKIREYDRDRGNRQDSSYMDEYKRRYPKKYKAHNMVSNHLKRGNISRKPCEVCGSHKSVAHHDDYSLPLDVRWLCQAHHMQWHAKNGEGKNPF